MKNAVARAKAAAACHVISVYDSTDMPRIYTSGSGRIIAAVPPPHVAFLTKCDTEGMNTMFAVKATQTSTNCVRLSESVCLVKGRPTLDPSNSVRMFNAIAQLSRLDIGTTASEESLSDPTQPPLVSPFTKAATPKAPRTPPDMRLTMIIALSLTM